MKMGFITAILEDYSFEEVIDFASAHGFSCVELACWPSGKAERRYAGVSHLDVDVLDEAKVHYVQEYCKKRGVEISSLAFYPNTMDPDLEKRAANIEHLKKLIVASLGFLFRCTGCSERCNAAKRSKKLRLQSSHFKRKYNPLCRRKSGAHRH